MYDFIIIGGGSAGCVLANRLSANPSFQVLLLEAGRKDNSVLIHMPPGIGELLRRTRYNWAFNTAPQKALGDREIYWPRGKTLGGSSSINGMIYIRGHAQDYNQWSQLGNQGWGYDDVLPYFKKSEHLEQNTSEFHGQEGPLNVTVADSDMELNQVFVHAGKEMGLPFNNDFNGAEQAGVGPYQLTKKQGRRWSVADAFLHPVAHRANLTIVTQAHTTRILFEGDQAKGVEYLHKGKRITATAKREVIVSAGAVQSPQVLMLSGVGPRQEIEKVGLPVVKDLPGVGQNLQDHLDITVQNFCKDPSQTFEKYLQPLRGAGLLFRWLLFKSGPGAMNPVEAGGFFKSNEALDYPDLQIHFIPSFVLDHGRQDPPGSGMTINICQLRPESRGHISLNSSDPLDAPHIQANYLDSEVDMQALMYGVQFARDMFKTQAFEPWVGEEYWPGTDVQTEQQIRDYVKQYSESIYHPVGTCKMGSDPMAVVSDQLKVHGLTHLRVVDASIMPTLVGGNTNAPTVMIAEKAADMILAEQAQ